MSTNAAVDDDDVGPLDAIEEHEYPGGLRLTAIVVALVLSIFLASLDTVNLFLTIITTAIPSITDDFHSLGDVGWYGSAMFFPMAATQSVWGKAYKYFPVKFVFLIGILIFEVGSLICAQHLLQTAMPSLLGAPSRAQAAPVSSQDFPIGHFCRRVGGRAVNWRRIYAKCDLALALTCMLSSTSFYINLLCGGVAAIATLLAFRAPKAASPVPATNKEKLLQMDVPGALLICAVIVCFTLALRWGGAERAWDDSKIVGTLVATPVFLVLFGLDQRLQGERALIMPSFLRNRVLLVGAIFEFFIAGCFNLALFYLPVYFQAVRGVSAVSSGIWLIPVILGLTITQIVVGGLITATGIHNPFLILGPGMAAVGSGLFMLLDQQSSAGRWIGFQIVLGIGVGLCLTIPLMLSQVAVKTKDVSTATSIVIFSQSMGSALLLPTAQAVFQNQLPKALRLFAPDIDPTLVLSAVRTLKDRREKIHKYINLRLPLFPDTLDLPLFLASPFLHAATSALLLSNMASDSRQKRLQFLQTQAGNQRDPELDKLLSNTDSWPDPPFTDIPRCRGLSDYADGLLIEAFGSCPAGIHEEIYNIPSWSWAAYRLVPSRGFFLGSPAKLTMYARPLTKLFNASVLRPSYRFAPEHAFPTGVEDAWATLKWAASHAIEIGADPERGIPRTWAPIFMGLNEREAVPEAYRPLWASHEQHGDALVIDALKAATMWEYYKPVITSPMFNPLASPFEKIGAMPKMFLQVAGHDMFRDDGLILAYALQDRGVEVKLAVYPGVCHSFWVFAPDLTLSKRFVSDIVKGFAWLLGVNVEALDNGWETAMAMPAFKVADT
ncbi:uncharacterized protein PG986_014595 [Apiospora aurea]|uniref:Alpha/beta hydrolase fold-3 domain-containing protein n=1 Tax=Apiospora aurea TaxID=335848 RepID=A0ABR1PTF8_9PEZI